jgi:orotidine-5'-phosphate decarboxylase
MTTLLNGVFCALDTTDLDGALGIARATAPFVGGFKVGMELFYARGRAGFRAIADLGKPVFLDLKLHDIPNTVAAAIRSLAPLAPAILNVHASGGTAMMRAASAAAADSGIRLIAVSVLTSLDRSALAETGVSGDVADQVRRLGGLAKATGLDGMVCSAHEIELLRAECGDDFLLVVPGIRPAGAATGDQKRVMTPAGAMALGADILVIGRPITAADDPAAAAAAIAAELEAGA